MGIKLMIFCLLFCINLVLFLLEDIFPGVVAVVHLMGLVLTYLLGTNVFLVGWVCRRQIWLVTLIPKCQKSFWLCRDIHHHSLFFRLLCCPFETCPNGSAGKWAQNLEFHKGRDQRPSNVSRGGQIGAHNNFRSSFARRPSFDINLIFTVGIYSNSLE